MADLNNILGKFKFVQVPLGIAYPVINNQLCSASNNIVLLAMRDYLDHMGQYIRASTNSYFTNMHIVKQIFPRYLRYQRSDPCSLVSCLIKMVGVFCNHGKSILFGQVQAQNT